MSVIASHSVESEPRENLRWFWVGLLVVCAVFSRGVFVIRPFDSDSSMFIYMGRLISEGGRFQHEIVDNKFPTVGLLMSTPWKILGTNWAGWVLTGMCLTAFACWRLAKAAADVFGESAFRPTLLASIVLLNFNFTVFGGFQLETLHVFFATIAGAAALYAIRRGNVADSFVVGLAAMTGAYAKPTALAVACAFAVAMVIKHYRNPKTLLAHGASCAVGAAIPLFFLLVYLVGADNLKDMPGLYHQISLYAKNSSWAMEDLNKPATVLLLAGFPFLVRGWIFRRQATRLDSDAPPLRLFLILWLAIELAGIILQRRMYAYHFLPLAVPLSVLFGTMPRKNDLRSIVAALVPLSILSMMGAANIVRYGYDPRGQLPASEYIRAHAIAGEKVWQDDAARLMLETNLGSASRHPLTFLFANSDDAPLAYGANLLKDFATHQPRFIVLPTDLPDYVVHQRKYILEFERFPIRGENFATAWKQIGAFVEEHYQPRIRLGHDTVWERAASPSLESANIATEP